MSDANPNKHPVAAPISQIPLLSSIQDFLFGAPLYAEYDIGSVEGGYFTMFCEPLAVDGHCPYCHRAATFHRSRGELKIGQLENIKYISVLYVQISCTRDKNHQIDFVFRIDDPLIQKIGQFPSLADIANDQSRLYQRALNPSDGAELHRAIGLAAHGIGVGSFVYLRRVFERLIFRRFEELKDQEGWSAAEFAKLGMEEKIAFLKTHLPDFLTRNKKMYPILSKGIHELEEDECLNAFEMLKHSIFFILDEDKHRLEQLALLWHFRLDGVGEEFLTVRTSPGWRPCEEVEDGLPDGRHAWLWRRSPDSFFSVPLL